MRVADLHPRQHLGEKRPRDVGCPQKARIRTLDDDRGRERVELCERERQAAGVKRVCGVLGGLALDDGNRMFIDQREVVAVAQRRALARHLAAGEGVTVALTGVD
jgi:hypothetical protein